MTKSPTSDGAPASIEPELPSADWDDWGYRTTCKLWEAVALSFGVSPASLDTFPGFDLVRPIPVPGRFKVRMAIAMNRVEEFRRSQGMDDRYTPPFQFIVSLPRFAEWARDTLTRDTLPDELLAMIPSDVAPASTRKAVTARQIHDGNVRSVDSGPSRQMWCPIDSIKRAPGYRWPLYQILKAAHIAGKPCPKARDVLEAWRSNPPSDIEVMSDGVKYNDGVGTRKEANLRAMQQSINGLLKKG